IALFVQRRLPLSCYSFPAPLPPPSLHSFPTRRSSDLHELTLQCSLGVQLATRGAATPEVERTYARALALCQQVGNTQELNARARSEEHTSELQSLRHLVCRSLLEKK